MNTECPINKFLKRLVAEEELEKSLNRARAECKVNQGKKFPDFEEWMGNNKPVDEFFTHVRNLHNVRMADNERISILTMLIRCHQYHHNVSPLLVPMPHDMKIAVEKLQRLINFHESIFRTEKMKYVKMLQYISSTEIKITDTNTK